MWNYLKDRLLTRLVVGTAAAVRLPPRSFSSGPLLSPPEFLKLPRGEAVVISPGYSSKKESNIPLRVKFKVAPRVVKEREFCSAKWQPWIAAIQRAAPKLSAEEIDRMMRERKLLVEALFPRTSFRGKRGIKCRAI